MMKNKTSIEMVKEFHEVFGHPIALIPGIPEDKNMAFRDDFIRSELDEIKKGHSENDFPEVADGFCDIQYVLDGWFLNAGLLSVKDELMAEIHRSNMSKVCSSEQKACETIRVRQEEFPGVQMHYDKVGDYWVVYRTNDGKVMKSVEYSEPDLKPILKKANQIALDELANPKQTFDPVNRPAHYASGKIEVIDFIEDKSLGFNLGNSVKYISRAGKKDPDKHLQDLEKAKWYLEREIETLKPKS